MKYLITGSSGFIGRNLIRHLKRNNLQFEELKLLPEKDNKLIINEAFLDKQLGNLKSSLNEFDSFIHLFWVDTNNWKSKNHLEFNLPLSKKIIKKISSQGLKNITVLGTCLEYGLVEGVLNENQIEFPHTNYSLGKLKLLKLLTEMSMNNQINLNWLRLFYVYGKDQPEETIYGSLKKSIKNNKRSFDMSEGNQIRDYLEISKAIEIIEKIACKKKNLGVINVCSGKGEALKSHVRKWVKEISPESKIELNFGYYPYRKDEPFSFWGDVKKLNKILES